MGFIVAVSAFIIPLIIFYVVVDGIIHQTDVYDVFVEGAKDGMKTVVSILPTLIGPVSYTHLTLPTSDLV